MSPILFHGHFGLPNSRAPLSRPLRPPKQPRFAFTATPASQTVAICIHGHFCLPNSRPPLSRSLLPPKQSCSSSMATSAFRTTAMAVSGMVGAESIIVHIFTNHPLLGLTSYTSLLLFRPCVHPTDLSGSLSFSTIPANVHSVYRTSCHFNELVGHTVPESRVLFASLAQRNASLIPSRRPICCLSDSRRVSRVTITSSSRCQRETILYSERCVCLTLLTPLFTSEYADAPNDPSAVSQIPGGSVGLQLHLPQDIKETILYSERCVCLTLLTPLFSSEYAYAPNDPSAVSQIPGGPVGLQLLLLQDIKETILYSERCVCLTPLTPLFSSEYAYAPNDPSAVSQIPGGSVGLQLLLLQDIKETILYSERCVCLTPLTPLFSSEYAYAPNDPSAVSQIPGGSVGLQLHLPQDIKETILYSERCVSLTLLTPLFTSEYAYAPNDPSAVSQIPGGSVGLQIHLLQDIKEMPDPTHPTLHLRDMQTPQTPPLLSLRFQGGQ